MKQVTGKKHAAIGACFLLVAWLACSLILKTESLHSSETSMNLYRTTPRCIKIRFSSWIIEVSILDDLGIYSFICSFVWARRVGPVKWLLAWWMNWVRYPAKAIISMWELRSSPLWIWMLLFSGIWLHAPAEVLPLCAGTCCFHLQEIRDEFEGKKFFRDLIFLPAYTASYTRNH